MGSSFPGPCCITPLISWRVSSLQKEKTDPYSLPSFTSSINLKLVLANNINKIIIKIENTE